MVCHNFREFKKYFDKLYKNEIDETVALNVF